jgi:hypothetical protein
VLGADVIYDRSEHEPIVDLLEMLLSEGGAAWLGEPNRDSAKTFVSDWVSRGRRARSLKTKPHPGEDGVSVIHELGL